MPKAPVELELYDENNEVVKKLSRVVVPWGVLKKSARLSKRVGKAEMEIDEELINEMTELVIEIFGEDHVSRMELEKYADISDMINVIRSIAARGMGLIPNAPPAV